MVEIREYVVTRIYTAEDLIALLGEGKKNVIIKISNPIEGKGIIWHRISQQNTQILQVEIRELVQNENTKTAKEPISTKTSI